MQSAVCNQIFVFSGKIFESLEIEESTVTLEFCIAGLKFFSDKSGRKLTSANSARRFERDAYKI